MTYEKAMTILRMQLERERNSENPDAARVERMMLAYKELETKAHLKLVFGERGRVQS